MVGKRVWFILGSCILSLVIDAQVPVAEDYFERLEHAGMDEASIAASMEDFVSGFPTKADLNRATSGELQQQLQITANQALELIAYREAWPPILSTAELSLIDGWDTVTIGRIKPLVELSYTPVADSLKWIDLLYPSQQLILRMSGKGSGFFALDTSRLYDGNSQRWMIRYRYTVKKKVAFGFIVEKDPGEPFHLSRKPIGFDYHSAYLLVQDLQWIETAILGDYHLQFGQGLTFWSGFALSSGAEMISGRRIALGIRPHGGTEENDFLRGTAVTFKGQHLKTTLFYSSHARDANLLELDTLNQIPLYTGFKSGGYHRNAGEREEKNILTEILAGGNCTYTIRRFRLGVTTCYQKFGGIISPSFTPSTWYKFRGNQNVCAGVDFVAALKRVLMYGEVAVSGNSAFSAVLGFDFFPETRINYSVHFRYAEADYQNFHANIFRISQGCNTYGVYQGLIAHLGPGVTFFGSVDLSGFMSPKIGNHIPGFDYRGLCRLSVDYGRNANVYLQCQYREGAGDFGTRNGITRESLVERSFSARIHYSMDVLHHLRILHRISYASVYGTEGSAGFLSYIDFRWHNLHLPLTLSARITLFETEGYASRIYAYESDVLYSFSVPAYYDTGKSVYINLSYRFRRYLTVYARYSCAFNPLIVGRESTGFVAVNAAWSVQLRLSL
ncbi:MAG: hypothetical protein EOL88_02715 [Bacteroidia bacterium]|nr:hypothetical protein [Bacteroidales bacterium]MDD3960278.1 hypothetical protein [Bacteroidales bacterium]MDY0284772.1 hypothetical protein [Bacteroidales bacterium]NCD40984.1 hypothetical protein [Bacteroidia bacterium]HPE86382.1 hypothetical protein [Bacteroidales bacterium]